ncbi:hypothetical protein WOLCODRAFT_163597 [Wolfiporia cocos MD-104 SS10]|uniref:Uncharacterized protein n=1 Tax=Wolfiporia cocos (strain MD-104) TaxID=742152 RepID=A0A2H3JJ19_WOLCO|nr:hypothetical protein WOLCODRAFT_163597 [Wolfiporia cocos MD-104 SS10]
MQIGRKVPPTTARPGQKAPNKPQQSGNGKPPTQRPTKPPGKPSGSSKGRPAKTQFVDISLVWHALGGMSIKFRQATLSVYFVIDVHIFARAADPTYPVEPNFARVRFTSAIIGVQQNFSAHGRWTTATAFSGPVNRPSGASPDPPPPPGSKHQPKPPKPSAPPSAKTPFV